MISLYVQVTGGQVGQDLQNDPEELAEALKVISDGFPDDLAEEVATYLSHSEAVGVKIFLEKLLVELKV